MPTEPPRPPSPVPRPDWDAVDGLRHDLLTPLTVIRARAQLLRRRLVRLDGPDRDRLVADLVAIEEATALLAARVDRLADRPADAVPPSR